MNVNRIVSLSTALWIVSSMANAADEVYKAEFPSEYAPMPSIQVLRRINQRLHYLSGNGQVTQTTIALANPHGAIVKPEFAPANPCPEGYAYNILVDVCSQSTYNPYDFALVRNVMYVLPDGRPVLFAGQGSSQYGVMSQYVYFEDGRSEVFINEFYATEEAMDAARQAYESQGFEIRFAGLAPGGQAGYQLQYVKPNDRVGFDYPSVVGQGVTLTEDEKSALANGLQQIPAYDRDGLQKIVIEPSQKPYSSMSVGSVAASEIHIQVPSDNNDAHMLQSVLFQGIGQRAFGTLDTAAKKEFADMYGNDTLTDITSQFGNAYARWFEAGDGGLSYEAALFRQPYPVLAGTLRSTLFAAAHLYNSLTGNILNYAGAQDALRPLPTKRTETRLKIGSIDFRLENGNITGYRLGEEDYLGLPTIKLPDYVIAQIPLTS